MAESIFLQWPQKYGHSTALCTTCHSTIKRWCLFLYLLKSGQSSWRFWPLENDAGPVPGVALNWPGSSAFCLLETIRHVRSVTILRPPCCGSPYLMERPWRIRTYVKREGGREGERKRERRTSCCKLPKMRMKKASRKRVIQP